MMNVSEKFIIKNKIYSTSTKLIIPNYNFTFSCSKYSFSCYKTINNLSIKQFNTSSRLNMENSDSDDSNSTVTPEKYAMQNEVTKLESKIQKLESDIQEVEDEICEENMNAEDYDYMLKEIKSLEDKVGKPSNSEEEKRISDVKKEFYKEFENKDEKDGWKTITKIVESEVENTSKVIDSLEDKLSALKDNLEYLSKDTDDTKNTNDAKNSDDTSKSKESENDSDDSHNSDDFMDYFGGGD